MQCILFHAFICIAVASYISHFYLVNRISFSQLVYTVNERDGQVETVLVLTNESSVDITVQVTTEDSSASELLNS